MRTSFCAPAAANLIFKCGLLNLSLNENASESEISFEAGVFLSSILPLTMLRPISAGLRSSRSMFVACKCKRVHNMPFCCVIETRGKPPHRRSQVIQ